MSIAVNNVTKLYGKQKALDQVSFEIPSGQIVGFLGPNGAGKSTMMKILTCYLTPNKGAVEVAGYNALDHSIEVKRRVGYLPEHNPLYLDMYVKEYLQFVGKLYKIPQLNSAVTNMIERVGLGPEQHKQIKELSKGYRQRVGLAQALIHDPEVLILDEPTSGLDPNQLVDIRQVIRDVGEKKTVMLSTHIMQEVEAICDRVIIINKGEIVTDQAASEIGKRSKAKGYQLTVEFEQNVAKEELLSIAGIAKAEKKGGNSWQLITDTQSELRPSIVSFSVEKGYSILTISRSEASMEDVFKELTGEG